MRTPRASAVPRCRKSQCTTSSKCKRGGAEKRLSSRIPIALKQTSLHYTTKEKIFNLTSCLENPQSAVMSIHGTGQRVPRTETAESKGTNQHVAQHHHPDRRDRFHCPRAACSRKRWSHLAPLHRPQRSPADRCDGDHVSVPPPLAECHQGRQQEEGRSHSRDGGNPGRLLPSHRWAQRVPFLQADWNGSPRLECGDGPRQACPFHERGYRRLASGLIIL